MNNKHLNFCLHVFQVTEGILVLGIMHFVLLVYVQLFKKSLIGQCSKGECKPFNVLLPVLTRICIKRLHPPTKSFKTKWCDK